MAKNELKKNQLNYLEVIALSVAIIAPTFAMSMNVTLMAGIASYSTGLVFFVSTLVIGCVAIAFVKFNQYISTAGSVYTFVQKSLGKKAGTASGWILFLAYFMFFTGCCCAFSGLFTEFINQVSGVKLPWIPVAIICGITMWYISINEVAISTRVMLAFEGITILMILVLSVVIIAKTAMTTGLSLAPFKLNGNSIGSIGSAGVVALLCFGGFEGASSLGEESKDPKKVIPFALASTVIVTGLFFIFVSYAQVIGFGITKGGLEALTKSSSTTVDLSQKYIGKSFAIVLTFGASLSAFSSALGALTAGARILFTMSRDGNVPNVFTKVHHKHSTPYIALNVMLAAAVVIICLMFKNDGITTFGYLGTIGALALLISYLLTCLGAIIYFKAKNIWKIHNLILPTVGLLGLAFAFYSNIYPVPSYPANLFPYIVLGWTIIGFVFSQIYRKSHEVSHEELLHEDLYEENEENAI
ncbi:APC family permease [Clostridium autoethanogenum]|uniref:APC family permease n=1 Tax=Clostridium autoethanogenum TaxID=84023 RepID=A0A3M0SJF7_9CLOT|nr:APC family permease [Clostridium autoethanogenum]RMC98375.1 APC family permease [Clostridium autoethanogenum]